MRDWVWIIGFLLLFFGLVHLLFDFANIFLMASEDAHLVAVVFVVGSPFALSIWRIWKRMEWHRRFQRPSFDLWMTPLPSFWQEAQWVAFRWFGLFWVGYWGDHLRVVVNAVDFLATPVTVEGKVIRVLRHTGKGTRNMVLVRLPDGQQMNFETQSPLTFFL